MKQLTATLIFLVSFCLTNASLADTDFSKIRKDIKVMNKIITGTIQSDEECGRCRASVRGSYLAKQGAIFVISSQRSYFKEVFISDGDWDVEHLQLEGLEQLEDLPEMISEIVSDVGIAIGEIDLDDNSHGDHEEHKMLTARAGRHSDLDRQTRTELRSLRREMRQLRDELRQQEIELIRAEDEVKEELEVSIRKLEDDMRELEDQRDALNDTLDKERERREQDLKKAKQIAEEKRQKQSMMLEHVVLNAMCDYGAALKNLPSNERITLLFEREGKRWADNQTKMYVLEKKDLVACQSENLDKDGLIENSITYIF